jgi:hypothetical protein
MQISQLNLLVALGLDASPELSAAFDELVFRAVSPLVGAADDDLQALLDAMSLGAADTAAFETARIDRSWRAALLAALDPELPGAGLRSLVREWMQTGIARLTQPGSITGTLRTPQASPAELSLDRVMGLSPSAAGFRVANAASVSAEPDDLLRVGTTLSWLPSRFLAAAASLVASEQIAAAPLPGSSLSPAAQGMALAFGCSTVANVLVQAGEVTGEAYAGCDEACTRDLCDGAMTELWSRVEGSNLSEVPWELTGAARAEIDDNARPASVSGTWVGSLAIDNLDSAPVQGPFSGTAAD